MNLFEEKNKESSNYKDRLVNELWVNRAVFQDTFIKENYCNWQKFYELCKERQTGMEDIDQLWQLIAFAGDLDVVKKYFSRNPDFLKAVHVSGRSPLHFAAWGGNIEVVKYFQPQCESEYTTECGSPLHYAALSGDVETIRYFANKKSVAELHPTTGSNLLQLAIKSGNIDAVRYVLSYKVNPNHRNHAGETALSIAEQFADKNIAELLEHHFPDHSGKCFSHFSCPIL